MKSDTSFTYKEGDKMLVDTFSEEKGHWIGADGWNIGRYETFEYLQRLETPKNISFEGQDAVMIGTEQITGMEGHCAVLSERTFFEGHFHHGKKHGPGRQIKRSINSNNITIREGNYTDNVAQGLFKQVKITEAKVKTESSFFVENGCYKIDQ